MATGSISSLGIGSGLELQSIIDQLREVDQKQTITPLEDDITNLDAQLDEFTVVKNKFLDMKSKALDLTLSSTFLARTVSSSDENVLTATVSDGATVGSNKITVNRLATKSSWLSAAGVSGTDTSVNTQGSDQDFVYTVNGTTVTVTVADGTTLSGLVTLINDDTGNPGVTASIIDDGDPTNPYYLLLKADTTGEDNRITIDTQLPDLNLTEQVGALGASLNAEVEIDGIPYQRQSNTINDIVSGVTLSLLSSGSASTVSVSRDDASITTLITDFVTAYNDAVQEVQNNSSYDVEKKEFGILSGTSIRDLTFGLRNLMTASQPGKEEYIDRVLNADGTITTTDNNIYSMFDLGLEFERDGTITIDSTVLESAISTKPESVQYFFLGDSTNNIEGFADRINEYLRTLTTGTGQIEAEKSAAQTRIDDLELKIESQTEYLDKKYDMLTQQFVDLDRYMNQMTSLSNFLTGQFDSLSQTLAKK